MYLLYLPISIFEVFNFYSALLARSAVIKFPHKPQPDVYGDIVFAMCSCELGLIGRIIPEHNQAAGQKEANGSGEGYPKL